MNSNKTQAFVYCHERSKSTGGSKEAALKKWLCEQNIEAVSFHEERIRGLSLSRPVLENLLDQPGLCKTIVVEDIRLVSRLLSKTAQRLSESLRHGSKLLIPGVLELPGNHTDEHIGFEANQKMLQALIVQLASGEREWRKERQMQGISVAKKKGRVMGGSVMSQKRIDDVYIGKKRGFTTEQIAQRAGCSVSSVRRVWRCISQNIYKPSKEAVAACKKEASVRREEASKKQKGNS